MHSMKTREKDVVKKEMGVTKKMYVYDKALFCFILYLQENGTAEALRMYNFEMDLVDVVRKIQSSAPALVILLSYWEGEGNQWQVCNRQKSGTGMPSRHQTMSIYTLQRVIIETVGKCEMKNEKYRKGGNVSIWRSFHGCMWIHESNTGKTKDKRNINENANLKFIILIVILQ